MNEEDKEKIEDAFGVPYTAEDPTKLVDDLYEAVRNYWNENLCPPQYIMLDSTEFGSRYVDCEDVWNAFGCRAVFLDDYFKDKTKKFHIK